jgi:PAS domain S-box-containing protein
MEELSKMQHDFEMQTGELSQLQQERDHLQSQMKIIQDVIPSSLILLNKDNTVKHWNRKAEELLDINQLSGREIFDLEAMGRERVREGLLECQRQKKPITVKSVSMKNRHGDRVLTNILHVPLIDKANEIHGSIIVIDDVTNLINLQSALSRKQEDMNVLQKQLKESYIKLKVIDAARRSQESVAPKPDIIKSTADSPSPIREEIPRNREFSREVPTDDRRQEFPTLKDKLRIYDEIDRVLDDTDEAIKTKKLDRED